MSSNPKDSAPLSWSELLIALRAEVKSKVIDRERVVELFSRYRSYEEDWTKYAFFQDSPNFTRNLVDAGNGFYNLLALCWNPGQGSCIHDHAGSQCVVKVLAGALTEIRYQTPREGEDFVVLGAYKRLRDEVCFIEDSIGVHEMKNHSASQAVTLHLYAPPFAVCTRFSRDTAAGTPCEMTYTSLYGELLPRVEGGEDVEVVPPCC